MGGRTSGTRPKGKGIGTGLPASGIPAHGTRPDFASGNAIALLHGGESNQLRERYPALVGAAERLVAEAVEGLPAAASAFAIQRGVLAERLVRYQLVTSWLDANGGEVDEKTAEAKGAANFAAKQLAAIERTLDALGLSPRSAAALYGDLARAVPLADALAPAREVRKRRAIELDEDSENEEDPSEEPSSSSKPARRRPRRDS